MVWSKRNLCANFRIIFAKPDYFSRRKEGKVDSFLFLCRDCRVSSIECDPTWKKSRSSALLHLREADPLMPINYFSSSQFLFSPFFLFFSFGSLAIILTRISQWKLMCVQFMILIHYLSGNSRQCSRRENKSGIDENLRKTRLINYLNHPNVTKNV